MGRFEELKKDLLISIEKEEQKSLAFSSIKKREKVKKHFDFLREKLEYVSKLQGATLEFQQKFEETVVAIMISNESESKQLSQILTYAVLIMKIANGNPLYFDNTEVQCGDLELLTTNETIILINAVLPIPIKDYETYCYILGSKNLLKSIEEKTLDDDEQADIFDEILDHCDEVAYENMNATDYHKAVRNCISIVTNYTKEKTY